MTDTTENTAETTEAAGPNEALANFIATFPHRIKAYVFVTEAGQPVMGPLNQPIDSLNLAIDICKGHVMQQAMMAPPQAANQDDTPPTVN